MTPVYPAPFRRFMIAMPCVMASMMVAVDVTIANVALPDIQATISASPEQILWVLTSYLIACGIATPLSGWLAGRFGRKLIMVCSVAGFTAASALCGMANDIEMLVLARVLQGACGAALVPLSQAVLLDITPPEGLPKAMAIYSVGSMAGPLIGPALGGWLTDALSWRWVFFINVPFGLIALFLIVVNFPESHNENQRRFDWFGFAAVAAALASFQLMIDRGEHLDWFDSAEIWVYAAILGVSVYLTIVHLFTGRDTFLRPELYRDRNFALGSAVQMLIGIVVFATVPLIVVMTQNLLGYSAFQTGIMGVPRALGTVATMLFVAPLMSRIDTRLILCTGLVGTAISMLMYSHMDLYVDERTLILVGMVQGAAGGLVFVPLAVLVFSTLPHELRNEGAAMNALVRNIGNAAGISLLQRALLQDTARSQSHLVEGIRPDSPAMQYAMPDMDFGSTESLSQINREVVLQASMVGNAHIFWVVFVLALLMIPLILMMRNTAPPRRGETLPIME